MLRQIGVEGIVTALHDVPNGEIWTLEAIKSLKDYIESHQLRWSVVESLPVSEAIKYAGPERGQLIENYKVAVFVNSLLVQPGHLAAETGIAGST